MNIKNWFSDMMPFQRKRASDWILPAVAGLGIGVAAGLGIGLLYAPSTGDEARLRLRERASRVKDRAAELATKARGHISSTTEQLALGHS
jgi:gas vesicle protein